MCMNTTEAYEQARAELARLIDSPDKTVSVAEYQSMLRRAKAAVRRAHRAMLADA